MRVASIRRLAAFALGGSAILFVGCADPMEPSTTAASRSRGSATTGSPATAASPSFGVPTVKDLFFPGSATLKTTTKLTEQKETRTLIVGNGPEVKSCKTESLLQREILSWSETAATEKVTKTIVSDSCDDGKLVKNTSTSSFKVLQDGSVVKNTATFSAAILTAAGQDELIPGGSPGSSISVNTKYVAPESVAAAAGTFNTYTLKIDYSGRDSSSSIVAWITPKIGPVKTQGTISVSISFSFPPGTGITGTSTRESTTSITSELTSYTP